MKVEVKILWKALSNFKTQEKCPLKGNIKIYWWEISLFDTVKGIFIKVMKVVLIQ